MADTTRWTIEISSFGHPITEKELTDAISKIPSVKTIDVDQLPPYHFHQEE